MSVRIAHWAWEQKVSDPSAKLVLLKLADSANDDGICWPSKRALALHCELNERSIRYKLEKLAALNLIRIEARARDNGSQSSNLYYLAAPPMQLVAPPHATGDTPPLQAVAPPEPSFESSVNRGLTEARPEGNGIGFAIDQDLLRDIG